MDYNQLYPHLLFLHVGELRARCEDLELSDKGTKLDLINRIIHFVRTGEKSIPAKYPARSISKVKAAGKLTPDSLMLFGSYKNDLRTRLLFKELIGQHFHFTAFGIDWLKTRWMAGEPPTYQEFADMWSKEYALRKVQGSTPKEEWAFIIFVKQYLSEKPHASRDEVQKCWEAERLKHKNVVDAFFRKFLEGT